jgi:hypothetical protein
LRSRVADASCVGYVSAVSQRHIDERVAPFVSEELLDALEAERDCLAATRAARALPATA